MAKVKPGGHIWALKFSRYVCFSFRGNQSIFGWDIANSIFDLEKSRSRSRRKSNQVIYRSGPTIVPKMKEIQKVVEMLSREQESAAAAYEPVQKHKATPGIPGWLHNDDVIMDAMASQITSFTIVYSSVYSGWDQRKHQSSASLAFVGGIHRGAVNSPHKWPVTRKMFPFDDVIIINACTDTVWWIYHLGCRIV